MIDYSTMTSYSPDTNRSILADLGDMGVKRDASFMGYTGIMMSSDTGSIALAEGVNNAGIAGNTFKHWIAKFSGEISDYAPWYYKPDETRCTRLDLQITIPSPGADYLSILETRLRYGLKFNKGSGRRRSVTLIRSDSCTLYYGSRNSTVYWRMYDKQGADGQWYIRWEFEVKGKEADYYMGLISSGEATREQVFKTLVGDTHPEYDYAVTPYLACCGDEPPTPKYIATTNRSTVDWLKSLTPTVERMLRSHQHGGQMRQLLDDWARVRARCDGYLSAGDVLPPPIAGAKINDLRKFAEGL